MTKFSNSERLRQRLPGGARGGREGCPGLRYPAAASRGRQAMQGQSGVGAAPRRQAGSDAGNAGGQLRRTQPRDPSWTAGQGPIRLLSPSSACCPLPRRRRRVAGPGQERGWPRPAGDALTPRQKGCGGPAPHGRAWRRGAHRERRRKSCPGGWERRGTYSGSRGGLGWAALILREGRSWPPARGSGCSAAVRK